MPPKAKPIPPPSFAIGIQTRAANKAAHPGNAHKVLDKKRRSPTEMKAMRDKEAQDEKEAQDKQTRSLANTAQIEDDTQQEDFRFHVG